MDADPRADASGRQHDPAESPWRTLAARRVYSNPWLSLIEYEVMRPDGRHGIYGVVDPGPNATIVALDEHEQVRLVGDFVHPLQRHMWGLPSGKVEEDETPLAAAQRELVEEAGVEATEWLPLGAYDLSPGIMTQVSHIFLARGLRTVAARPEGTERFTLRTQALREALDACLRGELRSAVTVLGIWRAWAYLHGID
jgi:8-oxo-dGTP pyrophosphatase MutT (NUDIX family)